MMARGKDDRPVELYGFTRRVMTGCGKLYCTTNYKDGKPHEIQALLGRAGGCAAAFCQGLGCLASAALEYGMPIERIIKQLESVSCHASNHVEGDLKLFCCPDGIADALKAASEITICPKCGSHCKENGKCINPDCNWKMKKPKEE